LRIAITGASGLLGKALIVAASPRHQIIAAVHSTNVIARQFLEVVPLDLTEPESIERFIDAAAPDLIIHSAAITDVDLCEREPELARSHNAEPTRQLAHALRRTKTRIVYLSTDYVFDGTSGPYTETDIPHPINVYGQTKLAGEEAILELGDRAAVVRSASFLGKGGPGRPTFAEHMLETMRERPPLKAAHDQSSNITPIDELASGILRLAESGAPGIWHIAHPRILSRYEFALLLAKAANLDPAFVERVDYASLLRAAARPLRGGLVTVKATKELALSWRPLEESVQIARQPL
jgi:dTDP-4-dehydrorhamnose reductase